MEPSLDQIPSSSPYQAATAGGPNRERGLDRVIDLLAHLHHVGRPVRIGDLARALKAPRSSVYALVKTLTDASLLESAGQNGEIFFGKTIYFYGMGYLRAHDLFGRARAEIERLAQETGETTQFCVLHERKYTIAHMSPGRRPFRISSEVGMQIPLPWTASGRLLLADFSDEEIRAMIPGDDLHPPRGAAMTIEDFLAAVAMARREGSCITSGLIDPYTHCIAAPIKDQNGRITATLCFVVLVDTPPERIAALRDMLVASGQALSLAPIDRRD
jgi:DNA-binding IclR family transcriptional regulator